MRYKPTQWRTLPSFKAHRLLCHQHFPHTTTSRRLRRGSSPAGESWRDGWSACSCSWWGSSCRHCRCYHRRRWWSHRRGSRGLLPSQLSALQQNTNINWESARPAGLPHVIPTHPTSTPRLTATTSYLQISLAILTVFSLHFIPIKRPTPWYCCPAWPVFNNLLLLIVGLGKTKDLWGAIWSILGDCPNLIGPRRPQITSKILSKHPVKMFVKISQ